MDQDLSNLIQRERSLQPLLNHPVASTSQGNFDRMTFSESLLAPSLQHLVLICKIHLTSLLLYIPFLLHNLFLLHLISFFNSSNFNNKKEKAKLALSLLF